MTITRTPRGENAVFVDNISQLEHGETEDACVAFSASNIWHSVQPGKVNPYTPEDIDVMADAWYTRFTGSITSSSGLSLAQLQEMLTGIGLTWVDIPLSHTPADDEKVRVALRAGQLVVICAAEDSFFDIKLGRPPYSWNTKPFNHAIVATGIADDGVNVFVRDTVAVSGGYPPSTQRMYDIGKMQYVSLTAVIPAWLTGGITMSGLPTGATDNGKDTITFPNGFKIILGFRTEYLKMAAAGIVPHDDMALENEHHDPVVELSHPAYWPKGGTVQLTRYFRFAYSPEHGVVCTWLGVEFAWLQGQLITMVKELAAAAAVALPPPPPIPVPVPVPVPAPPLPPPDEPYHQAVLLINEISAKVLAGAPPLHPTK